jgi:glutamate formiminotransferase
MALLECVPNVSEGRRPGVVASLAAVAAAEGVRLIDVSSDAAHHRSVLTLTGEPRSLVGAVESLCAAAADSIDLRRHGGVHPRLGVVDVVPFVPLAGSRMEEAVAAARECGARLGRSGWPVYLYGRAASRDSMRVPATLRRLGLDGLTRVLKEDAWRPDFGPEAIDPARGVVLVGARGFLVAFNLFLDTSDVAVARSVARSLRESSGGLPGVQALGFAHPRGAQVSTNLLEPEETSMGAVASAVEKAAVALGHRVSGLEVVGLVPRAAADLAVAEGLDPSVVRDRILEDR